MDIPLPKWPALLVTGEPVTEAQAAEILIKTSRDIPAFEYGSNEKELSKLAAALFGVPEDEEYPYKEKDIDGPKHRAYNKRKKLRYAAIDRLEEQLGVLKLQYLHNSQICSCFVGGPHGWLNWDGEVRAFNYNIGKWPSVDDVTKDWACIATAFPFLRLKCQLCNHEAGYPNDNAPNGPVVLFTVSDGKVTVEQQSPEHDPYIDTPKDCLDYLLNGMRSEWGISISGLKKKLVGLYGDIPQYKEGAC